MLEEIPVTCALCEVSELTPLANCFLPKASLQDRFCANYTLTRVARIGSYLRERGRQWIRDFLSYVAELVRDFDVMHVCFAITSDFCSCKVTAFAMRQHSLRGGQRTHLLDSPSHAYLGKPYAGVQKTSLRFPLSKLCTDKAC
jgi:hypothetical protein